MAVTTSTAPDIERSFLPTVPILESSSQLMDDTGLSEPQRVEIDATPLPLRKKRRRFASKKTTDKENAVLVHTCTVHCRCLNFTCTLLCMYTA